MFVQIIQGRIGDAAAARQAMERWERDLEPGAAGWLGGTYGITDDGMLVAVVRFESREAAQRNSARPEQAAWWPEMERCFAGPVTFHDCDDVMLLLSGGSDQAGFVQVIQGRVRDRDRMHALVAQSGDVVARVRPDVIGATIAPHVHVSRLVGTVLAFFLAVGVAAHCLDELHGRPLRTLIPGRVLVAATYFRTSRSTLRTVNLVPR